MQVFLPFKDTFRSASILDKKRLNKQIIELEQIINAIYGTSKGWKNHPVVKMYKFHAQFLHFYKEVLLNLKNNKHEVAIEYSKVANNNLPYFINQDYCDNFKKRLYTKDPIFYSFFKIYGISNENWYFVNDKWLIYIQK